MKYEKPTVVKATSTKPPLTANFAPPPTEGSGKKKQKQDIKRFDKKPTDCSWALSFKTSEDSYLVIGEATPLCISLTV